MAKLSVRTWIGNAAARLRGSHGDVSQAARDAPCSRQTVYDHADKVQQAVADAQLPGPSREQLLSQLEQARCENACLRQQLAQRTEFIECNEARRQRFAGRAAALGVTLSQTEELFDA